jgi:predicted dehydrogenase/aryl-alcohol dehydrogenase-like predicted oxidoreductase
MAQHLTWGILGAGGIARAFARHLPSSRTGTLLAIGSRTQANADAFGAEFGLTRCYGSYEALLADPEVQAIYLATPHPMHAEWAIKTAEAGKHLLCEKPLTMNAFEAMAVVEAARRHDVFLMEAFMYRCHPQTAKVVEVIREKRIGEVQVIQATFSFRGGDNPAGRHLDMALGGGGILDVGCYCTSMARLVAGAALGQDFADPLEVKGTAHLGATGADEWALASLRFPGDILAELACGVRANLENVVRIYGTEGMLLIPAPWFANREPGSCAFTVARYGEPAQEITVTTDRGLYAIEADLVAECLEARQAPAPAMSWADTLGNLRTLDRWRESIGLVYDVERPAAWTLPIDKRPLTVRPEVPMPLGTIPGVAHSVSRLIMGTMFPTSIVHASVLFDDFIARGGTAFDTAYVYGGGHSERALGQWVANRGIRKDVVIIGKGAHTPYCTPEGLTAQLQESLERLQTDYVDCYLLHRDNPEVPVGEFVDVLNAHLHAGRMQAFGGSNWAIERVEAANAYAAAHGLQGFTTVSNNFSLARMVNPLWGGSIASSDPASRAWFQQTGIPNLAWSSQARGFFTIGHPDDTSNQELVQSWYSPDNFARLARARHLAAHYGVTPVNIALAYVLCQPFPVFALIGPYSIDETRIACQALTIRLSPEELAWLDLATEAVPV